MTSPEAIRAAAAAADSVRGTATHEPRELDILCGKETKARNHKGSKCFRIFVDRYRKRYQEANNKHKRGEITKEMYLTITQANIRFLKFSDELNGWVEISSTEARDKITHALRFAQKRTSRKKNKKNVPQRQGSDSTHRSETSNTTATSYDWDQLLQTQQHLAGLSLGNMSSSLRASRSSFSSTGSASLLSKGDSSHGNSSSGRRHTTSSHKRGGGGGSSVSSARSKSSRTAAGSNNNNTKSSKSKSANNSSSKGVSFEPSVCSSTGGLATIYSASTKSSTSESIPLPVDLSSTQHFDMHQSAQQATSNLLVGGVDGATNNAAAAGAAAANQPQDRPPRMPSRPTEETEADDTDDTDDNSNHQHQHQHQQHHLNDEEEDDDEFDTIMNSTNTGFGEMLDPLLEIDQEENMRDSDSHSSASEDDDDDGDGHNITTTTSNSNAATVLRRPMVAPNGDLLPRGSNNNHNNTSNHNNLQPINIATANSQPQVSTSLHAQQQQQQQQQQQRGRHPSSCININSNSNNLMVEDSTISNHNLLEAVGDDSILDGFAEMNIDVVDPSLSSSRVAEGQEMLHHQPGDFQSSLSLSYGANYTTAGGTTTNNSGGLQSHHQQHQQQHRDTMAFHHLPNHHHDSHNHHHHNEAGDYSQLLMQEPLWEWEPQSRGKK